MKTIHVKGFSKDPFGRALKRGAPLPAGVKCHTLSGVKVDARLRFDRVSVEFDARTHRPYLEFSEGRLKSARVDLSGIPDRTADVAEVEFSGRACPEACVRWDLSNKEIQNLTGKGLFGFDYDFDHEDGYNLKPLHRGPIQVPGEFTNSDMEIPVECDVRVAQARVRTKDGQVKEVPVIGIYPVEALSLRTNSRVSGYEDLSEYFEQPKFLQPGTSMDLSEEETLTMEGFLDFLPEDEAENAPKKKRLGEFQAEPEAQPRPEAALSDEERERRQMAAEVHESVDASERLRAADLALAKSEKEGERVPDTEAEAPVPEVVRQENVPAKPKKPSEDSGYLPFEQEEDDTRDSFSDQLLRKADGIYADAAARARADREAGL